MKLLKRLLMSVAGLTFSFLLLVPEAYAQKMVSNLKEGERAKFSGVLVSPELFAELSGKTLSEEECSLREEFKLEKAKLTFDFKLMSKDLEIQYQREFYENRLKSEIEYSDELKKLSLKDEGFLSRHDREISFLSGIVFTVGTFVLADYILDYTN